MEYFIAWRSLITGFEGQSIIHHWPKAVAPETVGTSDLDTQPIMAIDDGVDTIILRRDMGE